VDHELGRRGRDRRPRPNAERLTTFVLPTDAPGVTIGPADRKMENRAQIIADVILEDVPLGADNVLATSVAGCG
jgi:alkylation response protein AidB-like acyl-CoA dehydrogenase